jgi:glutaredoxin
MTNAIIWTKNNSLDCAKAVSLAQRMGLTVEVRNINTPQWNLAALQAAIPGATTVPQIVIGDTVLGDFAALVAKAKEQQAAQPKVSLQTPEQRAAAAKSRIDAARIAADAARANQDQADAAAAMEGTTREQRHAARDAAIQKTQARIAAQTPAPVVTPQGYIQCAPMSAPPEHHQARFQESLAARPAKMAAIEENNAAAKAARAEAVRSRIQASQAARLQRLGG